MASVKKPTLSQRMDAVEELYEANVQDICDLDARTDKLEELDREGAILYLDLRTRCGLIEKAILAEDSDAIQNQVNDLKAVCLRKFTQNADARRNQNSDYMALAVIVSRLEEKLTTRIGALESRLNDLRDNVQNHKHLLPSGWTQRTVVSGD